MLCPVCAARSNFNAKDSGTSAKNTLKMERVGRKREINMITRDLYGKGERYTHSADMIEEFGINSGHYCSRQ